MDKLKIYTAITDRSIYNSVIEFMQGFDYIHCGQTQFGLDCAAAVCENTPDIIICGMCLYDTDAHGLYRLLKERDITSKCVFIVISSYSSSHTLGKLLEAGIDSVMLSPFDFIELNTRLRQLTTCKRNGTTNEGKVTPGTKQRITALLQMMAITPKTEAYNLLRDALILVLSDYTYLRAFTQRLYPDVGRPYGKSGQAAESIMRHAIERSWTKCPAEIIERVFGYTVDDNRGRPSVGQYISTLAEYLRNEM